MSLIDDTFAAVPGPLLKQWGQNVTYIKASAVETYNPTTGVVSGSETTVAAKAIIARVNPRESEGLYQATDLKFIMSADELGTYYPSERDSIQYTEAGATRRAKIIAITSYRGDNPVLHTLIARPQ